MPSHPGGAPPLEVDHIHVEMPVSRSERDGGKGARFCPKGGQGSMSAVVRLCFVPEPQEGDLISRFGEAHPCADAQAICECGVDGLKLIVGRCEVESIFLSSPVEVFPFNKEVDPSLYLEVGRVVELASRVCCEQQGEEGEGSRNRNGRQRCLQKE